MRAIWNFQKNPDTYTRKEIKICLSRLHSRSNVRVLVSVARAVGCSPKPFFCFPQGWNCSQASAAPLDSLSPPPRKLDVSRWCGRHHGHDGHERSWLEHPQAWGDVGASPPYSFSFLMAGPAHAATQCYHFLLQRLWRHCQGGGTQCKQRRPPLAPPTWTLWCEREIQLFVFLATVLLHLFVTAVFSEYYGMLPSNCPLRSSFPHISLRSASPGSLSNDTTVFIKKDGPNISHPFPTSSDLRKPSVLGPQWGKIQFPQNCQVCPKFFRL